MDMVAGSGEIFGICLPENFCQPFFSKTVPEFWRRWHITLGAWFKDYMFYPISMSPALRGFGRKLSGKGLRHLARLGVSAGALFPVWLCNGLWHGPRWSFLFFGMYYFVLIFLSIGVEPWVERWKAKIPAMGNRVVFAGVQVLRGGHRRTVFPGRRAPAGNPDVLFYDKGMAVVPAVGRKPFGTGAGPDGFWGNRGNGWGGVSCEYPSGEGKGCAAGGWKASSAY